MGGNSDTKFGFIALVIATIYYAWAIFEKILKIKIINFPFEWITGIFLIGSIILLVITLNKWSSPA